RVYYLRGRWAALKYLLLSRQLPEPSVTEPRPEVGPLPVPGAADDTQALGSVYRLRQYPDAVDVFVSDDALQSVILAWENMERGGVRWHRIQGEHDRILHADHVNGLARIFKAALDRAQERARSSTKAGGLRRTSSFVDG